LSNGITFLQQLDSFLWLISDSYQMVRNKAAICSATRMSIKEALKITKNFIVHMTQIVYSKHLLFMTIAI